MRSVIRPATPDDAVAILGIYGPFVENTAVSFETTVPAIQEMQARVSRVLSQYPWLVWDDGGIKGYAYATPHRERSAYQWSVEVSVYLAPDSLRQGIGRRLYEVLLELLRAQGIANAYAGIVLPNQASVAFHESFGFERIALYSKVGWKQGRWRDVGWWHRRLIDSDAEPQSIRAPDYSLIMTNSLG